MCKHESDGDILHALPPFNSLRVKYTWPFHHSSPSLLPTAACHIESLHHWPVLFLCEPSVRGEQIWCSDLITFASCYDRLAVLLHRARTFKLISPHQSFSFLLVMKRLHYYDGLQRSVTLLRLAVLSPCSSLLARQPGTRCSAALRAWSTEHQHLSEEWISEWMTGGCLIADWVSCSSVAGRLEGWLDSRDVGRLSIQACALCGKSMNLQWCTLYALPTDKAPFLKRFNNFHLLSLLFPVFFYSGRINPHQCVLWITDNKAEPWLPLCLFKSAFPVLYLFDNFDRPPRHYLTLKF